MKRNRMIHLSILLICCIVHGQAQSNRNNLFNQNVLYSHEFKSLQDAVNHVPKNGGTIYITKNDTISNLILSIPHLSLIGLAGDTLFLADGSSFGIKILNTHHIQLRNLILNARKLKEVHALVHSGGWYATFENVEIIKDSCWTVPAAFYIDAGKIGTFVSSYSQIITPTLEIHGNDSPALPNITTLMFRGLDALQVRIANADGISFQGAPLQAGDTLVIASHATALSFENGWYEGDGHGYAIEDVDGFTSRNNYVYIRGKYNVHPLKGRSTFSDFILRASPDSATNIRVIK